MKEHRYKIPGQNGEYVVFEAGDCEKVNPIEYYQNIFIPRNVSMYRRLYLAKEHKFKQFGANLSIIKQEVLFRKNAIADWKKWFVEKSATEINPNYLALLESKTKKEQVKLLKGIELTTYELFALIVKAYTDYGMLFSQYRYEHTQKGVDEKDLTEFAHLEDSGKVITSRKTKLSQGQLKQAIEHRVVLIAKFIETEDEWHCFFTNYKSLNGKEITYKGGKPHYHYISDKWGLTKEQVIKQLSSRKYKLPSMPHLDFKR